MHNDDMQEYFRFPNGYGASVISNGYGGAHGLWELAVIGPHGHIDTTTPVTNDVLGWLTPYEVETALIAIANLPHIFHQHEGGQRD